MDITTYNHFMLPVSNDWTGTLTSVTLIIRRSYLTPLVLSSTLNISLSKWYQDRNFRVLSQPLFITQIFLFYNNHHCTIDNCKTLSLKDT